MWGIIEVLKEKGIKDINVKKDSKAVGVYYTALNGDKSSPSWDLPVDANLLNILGSIQTAIGVILILLVVFRSRLLKSFQNRWIFHH